MATSRYFRALSLFALVLMAFPTPAAPIPKNPPTADEPYVEFDFSTFGGKAEGDVDYQLYVLTAEKDVTYNLTMTTVILVPDGKQTPTTLDEVKGLAESLEYNKARFVVVDKLKVRVYGVVEDGKYYPATKGTFTSKRLKADELPTITQPKGPDAKK